MFGECVESLFFDEQGFSCKVRFYSYYFEGYDSNILGLVSDKSLVHSSVLEACDENKNSLANIPEYSIDILEQGYNKGKAIVDTVAF